MKKFGFLALTAVLLTVVLMNIAAPAMAAVAFDQSVDQVVAPAGECTEMRNGCRAGGGSEAFCYGMWCGCLYEKYGEIC
jgi:hypothetical protein